MTTIGKSRRLGVWLAAIGVLLSLPALASAAGAQQRPPQYSNEASALSMASRLNLNPSQQALLRDFTATSARSAQLQGLSAEQLRALSLMQRLDYWSQHMTRVVASAQVDAASLRRFYGSLTTDQKAQFDAATRPNRGGPMIAGDVMESTARDTPDYKMPARIEADWLIKPMAENISRVYPSAAVQAHVAGKVVLRCTADEDGYLTDCLVLSETPKDFGFGNAALEVTGYMRMQPATEYGVPVRSTVRVPLTFSPEEPE
jgi:TonB family protein